MTITMMTPGACKSADGEKSLAALSAAAAKIVESVPSSAFGDSIKPTKSEVTSVKHKIDSNQLHPLYGVQPFIAKLYQMISSCHNDHPHIASWDDNGQTFVIKDTKAFSSNIMPNYMQTRQFDSFIRNLNFYDFHKIHALPIPKSDQDPVAKKHVKYRHPHFQRDRMDLIREIKRSTRKVRNAAAQQEKEMDSLQKRCACLEDNMKYLISHVQQCHKNITEMQQKIAMLENTIQSNFSGNVTTKEEKPSPAAESMVLSSLSKQYSNQFSDGTITGSEAFYEEKTVLGTTKGSEESKVIIPATDQRERQSKRQKTEKLGTVRLDSVVDLKVLIPKKDSFTKMTTNNQRLF